MRVHRVILVGLLALSGSASVSASRSSETGFLDRTVTVNQVIYRYQVYVPNGWTKGEKWPVVLFLHGAAERGVPTDESRKMNEALKAAGGNVKYTEYDGVAHNSWDRAYAEPELMTWMLAQRLPSSSRASR